MQIVFKRVNHFQVPIPLGKEREARIFYGEVLQLDEIVPPTMLREEGWIWFRIGEVEIHIGVDEHHQRSERHVALEVDNLEDIKAYLQEQGVEVRVHRPLPHVKRLSFYDPFGNRMELMEKY